MASLVETVAAAGYEPDFFVLSPADVGELRRSQARDGLAAQQDPLRVAGLAVRQGSLADASRLVAWMANRAVEHPIPAAPP